MDSSTGFFNNLGSNVIVYVITLIVVLVFIYFIYRFIYSSNPAQTSIILNGKVKANDTDISTYKYNVKIPNIIEGGEFTVNFWIYIAGYTYLRGQRKHLVEIGYRKPENGTTLDNTAFSTILIALGATKPSLLVRTHTTSTGSTPAGTSNYGIVSCSSDTAASCTGGALSNYRPITDTNLMNNTQDGRLTVSDITTFLDANAGAGDEDSLLNQGTVCDVDELPMQKWINICTVMNGKTLDIYINGKLVKTCVYKNYFRVHSSGNVLSYLQGGATTGTGATAVRTHGFDGSFSRLQVFNSALTPDDIYKTYLAGPNGDSPTYSAASFLKYIFFTG